MFKPEYILEDVATFGMLETVELMQAKFMRLGKARRLAYRMAYDLVLATLDSRPQT